MYQSRIHFRNEAVQISFDSLTGEILELLSLKNGDNLIKSTPWQLPSLFAVKADGVLFSTPLPGDVRRDASVAPAISIEKNTATLRYPRLKKGERMLEVEVTCRVTLDGERILWSAEVNNRGGAEVEEFRYPVLSAMWLGDDFADDVLVYPFNAGVKVQNPSVTLAQKAKKVFWRWQDYCYTYNIGSLNDQKNEEGLYGYSFPFSGPLSMAWCDLYDPAGGLYLGMHRENGVCYLHAETMGADAPGMILSVARRIESRENFAMEGLVTAFHDGDWHDGADIYRAAWEREKRPAPAWWNRSVALAAHYDFRYQCGGVVHTYGDMGMLARQADEIGCDHILCSGWHVGGFDNGFPEYVADDELGGEQGLREGIEAIHRAGKKVSFYINTRIANLRFENEREFIEKNASVRWDGSMEKEYYGDESLCFAGMCAASRGWQDRLIAAADYVRKLGADGVYFDQLAMAAPRMCHAEDHGHDRMDAWCAGYRRVLETVRGRKALSGEDFSVITEGVSNLYGDVSCGGLVSTFSYQFSGAFPELYRYAFPEHGMVDMVYPNKNLAMRPVHVGKAYRTLLDRAYVCGMYLWVYNLEEDNTFRRDEEARQRLLSAVAARRAWLERGGHYRFADDKGLHAHDAMAKRYDGEGRTGLVAFAHDGEGRVEMDFEAVCSFPAAVKDGHTYVTLPAENYGTFTYERK